VKKLEANNKPTLEGITAQITRCKDYGDRIGSGRKNQGLNTPTRRRWYGQLVA